jgi:hypothetical protein
MNINKLPFWNLNDSKCFELRRQTGRLFVPSNRTVKQTGHFRRLELYEHLPRQKDSSFDTSLHYRGLAV